MRWAAILLAAALLAACGGGSSSPTGASAAPPHPATPSTEKAVYDQLGVDASRGAACDSEMATFTTAVSAYQALNAGALPPAHTVQGAAKVLVSAKLLKSDQLETADAHNPPAAFHFYYDVETGQTVRGAGC